MLKRQNRLTTRFQHNITRHRGTSYPGKYVHVFVLEPKKYEGPPQIGIVTSKKLHKTAATRNRIKRLYRDCPI